MTYSTQKNNIYYVLDNCCNSYEDALEVQELYAGAGIATDIVTETEYFAKLHSIGILPLEI